MYIVVVNLKVKSEFYDEFMRRLNSHVVASRSEGRCENFDVARNPTDVTELLYYEEYPNSVLFNEHINSERVARHLSETAAMIDGEVRFNCWESVDLG